MVTNAEIRFKIFLSLLPSYICGLRLLLLVMFNVQNNINHFFTILRLQGRDPESDLRFGR